MPCRRRARHVCSGSSNVLSGTAPLSPVHMLSFVHLAKPEFPTSIMHLHSPGSRGSESAPKSVEPSLGGGPAEGVRPSRRALRMSAAFQAAYRCMSSKSGGSSPNWLRICTTRGVREARLVRRCCCDWSHAPRKRCWRHRTSWQCPYWLGRAGQRDSREKRP